ncbi:hypothetical protein [Tamaricihabitans halophyticus]|nr:hypothetical protein [Tamaricihabitans halophyticus]
MTPSQIYDRVHNGPGAGSLGEAEGMGSEIASSEGERVGKIQQLKAEIESGWQGKAGAGAAGAAAPLAESAQQGANQLGKAQSIHTMQRDVFDNTKNSVIQIPENPPEPNFIDQVFPFATDHAQKAADYQAKAEYNMQVFEKYEGTSSSSQDTLPTEYGQLRDPGGEISMVDRDGGSGYPDQGRSNTPPPGMGNPGSNPGTGNPGTGNPGTGNSPGYSGFSGNTPGSSPGNPGIGTTPGSDSPGSTVPGSTTPAGYAPPGSPSYNPAASANPGAGSGPGGMGFGPVGGGTGFGGGAGGSSTGSGIGTGAGSGLGGGRLGGGTGAGAGAGAGGSAGSGAGAGQPGAGARTGAGPLGAGGAGAAGGGGLAAGGLAAGGPAGGRAGGMPMAGGMGGGRGQGGEDEEHQRASFLVEPDAEGVFGTDQLTAPPVIGE